MNELSVVDLLLGAADTLDHAAAQSGLDPDAARRVMAEAIDDVRSTITSAILRLEVAIGFSNDMVHALVGNENDE